MAQTALRRDETIGLSVALVLHLALAAALLLQPVVPEQLPDVERVSVSLAEDVGLAATAPVPVPESRAAIAPTLSEMPQPAPAISEPIPAPRPVATSAPRPQPQPRATRAPQPRATSSEPRRRPDRPTSRPTQAPAPAPARGGGSRLGDNFLEGAGASTTSNDTRLPASEIGNSAKASLVQALARQIKPHWQPPSGPDVDRITTFLSFRLNPDGSLAGRPSVLRQTGVNDTNRAQADRHAEQAVRAVQLAAPFDLPDQYYNAWKLVSPFGFDWKLAQ